MARIGVGEGACSLTGLPGSGVRLPSGKTAETSTSAPSGFKASNGTENVPLELAGGKNCGVFSPRLVIATVVGSVGAQSSRALPTSVLFSSMTQPENPNSGGQAKPDPSSGTSPLTAVTRPAPPAGKSR